MAANHQMRRCGHCGSVNTQAGLDCIQCLACGELTRSDGTTVAPAPKFYAPGVQGLPDAVKEG